MAPIFEECNLANLLLIGKRPYAQDLPQTWVLCPVARNRSKGVNGSGNNNWMLGTRIPESF